MSSEVKHLIASNYDTWEYMSEWIINIIYASDIKVAHFFVIELGEKKTSASLIIVYDIRIHNVTLIKSS